MKVKTWFDCGWNDVVYGLRTCRTTHDMLSYIANMRRAGEGVKTEYAQGCLVAINHALTNGKIPSRR